MGKLTDMNISWRKTKGKFVIKSNGAYLAFNDSELEDLKKVIAEINNGDDRYMEKDNRR